MNNGSLTKFSKPRLLDHIAKLENEKNELTLEIKAMEGIKAYKQGLSRAHWKELEEMGREIRTLLDVIAIQKSTIEALYTKANVVSGSLPPADTLAPQIFKEVQHYGHDNIEYKYMFKEDSDDEA